MLSLLTGGAALAQGTVDDDKRADALRAKYSGKITGGNATGWRCPTRRTAGSARPRTARFSSSTATTICGRVRATARSRSGAHHTMGETFGEHKRADFFVRHLLGVNPPKWNELK